MAVSQANRDDRFLLAVLVAMNALAIAAVFELGGVKVFALLSLLAVLVTGIGVWTARTVDRGLEGSTKLREWRMRLRSSLTWGLDIGVVCPPDRTSCGNGC
jgi:hypothetical protein